MNKDEKTALAVIPVAVAIGAALAWAGGSGGQLLSGIPVMYLVVGYAFIVQWLVFVPAIMLKTERFYDLTGGLTYMSIAVGLLVLLPGLDLRSQVILACIFTWSARLGFFLFLRIWRSRTDSRFDQVRTSFLRFLMAWTLQGLWVSFSVAAGIAAVTARQAKPIDVFFCSGLALWVLGFAFEAVADAQKSAFRRQAPNHGRFITTGLWAMSRHPNYFGEIVLWFGVAVMAFPVLMGLQYFTLISPLMVTLLLTRISGIPLLEAAADKKWGGGADYERYKSTTPILVPRVFGMRKSS